MKPSKEAIEAAEKITGKPIENTNQSRYRDHVAEIIQSAIDEAYKRGMNDRALKHLMELQKAESRPAQEFYDQRKWREIHKEADEFFAALDGVVMKAIYYSPEKRHRDDLLPESRPAQEKVVCIDCGKREEEHFVLTGHAYRPAVWPK